MIKPDTTTFPLGELRLNLDSEEYPNLSMYSHWIDVSILVTNHLEVVQNDQSVEGMVGVVDGYVYEGYETDYDEDNDLHAEVAAGMESEMDEEDFEIMVGEALRDLNDNPPEYFSPLTAAVDLRLIDDNHVVDLLLEQGQLDAAVAGLVEEINNHDWDDVALAMADLEREETRAALAASPAFQACLQGAVTAQVARNWPRPSATLIDLLTRAGNITALEQVAAHRSISAELLQMLARHPEPTVQTAALRRH